MTTIDPTALLALADACDPLADFYTYHGHLDRMHDHLDPDTVRALVAAYVERDVQEAELKRLGSVPPYRAGIISDLTVEVTALRAAVARMTGAEAVEAAAQAISDYYEGDGSAYYLADAAAAVRAITALGAALKIERGGTDGD